MILLSPPPERCDYKYALPRPAPKILNFFEKKRKCTRECVANINSEYI
jgi:hypothetical protein